MDAKMLNVSNNYMLCYANRMIKWMITLQKVTFKFDWVFEMWAWSVNWLSWEWQGFASFHPKRKWREAWIDRRENLKQVGCSESESGNFRVFYDILYGRRRHGAMFLIIDLAFSSFKVWCLKITGLNYIDKFRCFPLNPSSLSLICPSLTLVWVFHLQLSPV